MTRTSDPPPAPPPPVPVPPLPLWKRGFDVVAALGLMVVLSPFFAGVTIAILMRRDGPVFYVSERMKTVDHPFQLIKFRTMRPPAAGDDNAGVSGGDKRDRITPLGHRLRRYRLDETPQLVNVLRGDISFVGPRPPLRRYTESHRDLYHLVLQNRPGVTGLASLTFHRHEEMLLAETSSSTETEAVYVRRCMPRKARIDLIYQARRSLWLDLEILLRTASRRRRRHRRRVRA